MNHHLAIGALAASLLLTPALRAVPIALERIRLHLCRSDPDAMGFGFQKSNPNITVNYQASAAVPESSSSPTGSPISGQATSP